MIFVTSEEIIIICLALYLKGFTEKSSVVTTQTMTLSIENIHLKVIIYNLIVYSHVLI